MSVGTGSGTRRLSKVTRLILLSPLALLASCAPSVPDEAAPVGPSSSEALAPAASSAPATAAHASHYTSLERCPVVRDEREEMPYREVLCDGFDGWALRIADSDARQTLAVLPPGGDEVRLDTARIGGGGFSSFGNQAEWRTSAGQTPRSLIVRYQVAERPHPAPETSYLLVVSLGRRPCVAAVVPPGSEQNAAARRAADRPAECLDS